MKHKSWMKEFFLRCYFFYQSAHSSSIIITNGRKGSRSQPSTARRQNQHMKTSISEERILHLDASMHLSSWRRSEPSVARAQFVGSRSMEMKDQMHSKSYLNLGPIWRRIKKIVIPRICHFKRRQKKMVCIGVMHSENNLNLVQMKRSDVDETRELVHPDKQNRLFHEYLCFCHSFDLLLLLHSHK